MKSGSKIAMVAIAALAAAGGMAAARAEQDGTPSELLVTEKDLLTKAANSAELKMWFEGLREAQTPAGRDEQTLSPGTTLLVGLDGPASYSLLPVPGEDGGLLLTPEAARQLLTAHSIRRLIPPRLDVAFRLFRVQANASPERTVAPDDIMSTPVPDGLRALPDYKPRPTTMPAAARSCALSQNIFLKDIEGELRTGRLSQNLSDEERAALSSAAKAFDNDCLERIASAPSDPMGVPLDRLAILTDTDEGSFCMAAYLGGGRFLTANHCRFDEYGTPRDKVVLSLADGSKANLVAQFAAEGAPASSRGAVDWAVLVAPALNNHQPASVLRAVAPAIHRETRLIGYFALADLEATILSRRRPQWKDALRATRDIGIDACRVVDLATGGLAGGCVMHDCQSLPGFSGAPLFVRGNDGSWGLAGIHVASAQSDVVSACPAFAGAGYFAHAGNIAASVPVAIANQLNSGS